MMSHQEMLANHQRYHENKEGGYRVQLHIL